MPNTARHWTRASHVDYYASAWTRRSAANQGLPETEAGMPPTLGQSVWVEGIDRDAIDLGTLQALIECDGISGALCARTQSLIGTVRQPSDGGATHIAVRDVQDAADLFRTQHLLSAGRDGFVSVEISADAQPDARRTYMEARGLWLAIGRRNVLIGIPGVRSNLSVVRDLVAAGINVNVTMLYGAEHFRLAFEAYCAGLEARQAMGHCISDVRFVATFCIEAIDAHLERMLSESARRAFDETQRPHMADQVGIAYATVVHRRALSFAVSERFVALARRGAQRPRLLWLLADGKGTHYSRTHYLDSLVRSGALCGMPLDAASACQRAGILSWRRYSPPVQPEFARAMHVVVALRRAGVDVDAVANELQAAHAARRTPIASNAAGRGH